MIELLRNQKLFGRKLSWPIKILSLNLFSVKTVGIPGRAGFRLDEALSYFKYGALYKSRYSMSVTNMIFGYLEG
jgi:hypothetical protein